LTPTRLAALADLPLSGGGKSESAALRLSIIIPALNEAAGIAATLEALAPFRTRGVEVMVVDGGSHDGTIARARPLADRVLSAPRGRAVQMNTGAAAASGDVLLFLHADTILPPDADGLVLYGLADSQRAWGRFDVVIDSRNPLLHLVAGFMNWRSQISGIATGDQAMFATREAFAAAGGFPDIALMEDVALSARLKRIGRPLCLAARARTSARRWTQHGIVRTILLMWRLRLAYWLGAEPAALARRYGAVPRD
jgi:rSAM/selenodomain-associated transferase 2